MAPGRVEEMQVLIRTRHSLAPVEMSAFLAVDEPGERYPEGWSSVPKYDSLSDSNICIMRMVST